MRRLAKWVLVVEPVAGLGVCQVQQVARCGQDLAAGEHRGFWVGPDELGMIKRPRVVSVDEVEAEQLRHAIQFGAKLAIQLVTADLG